MKKIFGALAASAALALTAAPTHAAVVLANPSSFNGEEIVFNDVDAVTSGTQILGFTNQSHTGYFFEGTTSSLADTPTTSNLLNATGGLGQAVITPGTKDYFITSLWFYRQDGGLFNDAEFRFVKPTQDAEIRLFGYDQNNVEYDLGIATLGGDNRFGFQGTAGDLISKIKYVASKGGTQGHKQTRVEDFTPTSAIPEPSTWGMMILGLGVAGAAMRRRQRQSVRFSFA